MLVNWTCSRARTFLLSLSPLVWFSFSPCFALPNSWCSSMTPVLFSLDRLYFCIELHLSEYSYCTIVIFPISFWLPWWLEVDVFGIHLSYFFTCRKPVQPPVGLNCVIRPEKKKHVWASGAPRSRVGRSNAWRRKRQKCGHRSANCRRLLPQLSNQLGGQYFAPKGL